MRNKSLAFVNWVLKNMQGLQAPCDSEKDKILQKFESQGFLECYDCMFGNNYYAITNKGRTEFLSAE